MKQKRLARPKPIAYTLIPDDSDIGRPMYEQLNALVAAHHDELFNANVRIALAWATNWKADVDGRLVLGKCKKASDLDRELAPFDFVILLNQEFWQNPRVLNVQRDALLDHELMHAAVAFDENGEPKQDERGRTVFRIRKHDLEEFSDIFERYGCWKKDLEAFARALGRAQEKARSWVGYSQLREALRVIGHDVEVSSIATWSDEERRDVLMWTELHRSKDAVVLGGLAETMPRCLGDVLGLLQPPAELPPASADGVAH